MRIVDMKTSDVINAVASDAPAPGGGSVAALAGSIGVALTMMVNGFTLSKPGFEESHDVILDGIAKGSELKDRFVDMMNRDTEVFDLLIDAYALPKETEAQKAVRRGAVQGALHNCTEIPLVMMRICDESIDLLDTLIGRTNPNLVSDLGIAAYMLKAAMESAWLNVLINIASLKDKEYAQDSYDSGKRMLEHAIPIVDSCCERAQKLIEEKISL